MNREIIYRAWHKKLSRYLDKEELTQLYIKPSGEPAWYNHNVFESTGSRLIIEQYTGIKDKNGAKIFEGDLVMVFDDYIHIGNEGDLCIVKWGGYYPAFDLYDTDTNNAYSEDYNSLSNDTYIFEVIGNIHQNKDLLNE